MRKAYDGITKESMAALFQAATVLGLNILAKWKNSFPPMKKGDEGVYLDGDFHKVLSIRGSSVTVEIRDENPKATVLCLPDQLVITD